jgi:glycosyltransferase involved in cell wall biosynthesis
MEPIISIGLPVYNCAHTLAQTIRSILFQSFPNWELLVLDDGSTDRTVEAARKFQDSRIRLIIDGKRMGMPERLNQSIKLSMGRYFGRIDGDDIAYPGRFAAQIEFLRQHPDVDLIGGGGMIFFRDGQPRGKRVGPQSHEGICRRPASGFPMMHPAFLGHTEWFKKWGYNPKIRGAPDQDLLLRSFASSRFGNLPQLIIGYREESLTIKKSLLYRRSFCMALIERYGRDRPWTGMYAIMAQLGKLAYDTVAISTRLNYRLLRHRAMPTSSDEKEEWRSVWYATKSTEIRGNRKIP